jgi:hypothetical protein
MANEQQTTTNAPAPPPGETAASWASVQAGKAKLEQMLAAPKNTKPAPVKPSAPPVLPEVQALRGAAAKAEKDRVAALPKFEQRRLELTRALTEKNSKLTDAERAALTKELRELVAGQMTQAERDEILNAPISELRDMFAIAHERVQPHLREHWDEEGEAEVLASFAHAGVSREGARTVMGWYMDKFNQHLGDIDNVDFAAMEAEFRTVAKKAGLSERHINALIANERERLEG